MTARRQSRLVSKNIKRRFFNFNWLPRQRLLSYQKTGLDRSSTNKYLSFGAKTAKIGPADPEKICLRAIIKKIKKKEINASKIYCPSGKFAERAKKHRQNI